MEDGEHQIIYEAGLNLHFAHLVCCQFYHICYLVVQILIKLKNFTVQRLFDKIGGLLH